MKKIYISFLILSGLFLTLSADAQIKIGTNGATIAPSSLLELESQNQGLLLPRLTDTVAINALAPPNGMLIYLTRGPAVGLYVRKVSGWEYLTGSMGGNGNFNSLTVSGSVTAGNFTGPLNGNATSANTATNATNSLNSTVVNDLSTPNPVYPTFVNTTPGNAQLRTSTTKLSFIPNTGILTATGFAGPLTGDVTGNATSATNATNASNTDIINEVVSAAVHYPTFVSGSAGNLPQLVSNPGLNFVPSTGTLSATRFAGTFIGNATTSTNALTTTITNDNTSAAVVYPTFVTASTGNMGQRTADARLTFVPSTGVLTSGSFTSTVATGTAPFVVSSSTVVPNLSATNTVNTLITDDVLTNQPVYPTFVLGTSGNLGQRTASSRLSFVPSTGAITANSFNGALNGNATSATNVTGVVALVNGGTGATTRPAAFDALSPMTTAGDIIYMSPAGTGTRLPAGGPNTFLRAGATPSWTNIDLSTADVTGVLTSSKGGTGVNNAFTLTLAGANTTLNANAAGSNVTLPALGTVATLAGLEPLTNKTINGNTITTGTGTLTLGAGSTLATSGANSITLTSTAPTNVTVPTTGTLATLAGTEALTNKTINGNNITAGTGTLTLGAGSTLTTSGANPITLTSTAPTNVTVPTTGTLATLNGIEALTNKTINGNTVTAGTGILTLSAGSTLVNAGGNSVTLTSTGATNVTFPTTGTLATRAGVEALTNKTINGNTITTGTGTLTLAPSSTLATSGANSITLTSTGLTSVILPTSGTLVAAISGSQLINFASTITSMDSSPTTISVPGAVDGDTISLGVPIAAMVPGAAFVAWVSSADNVTVRFINYSGAAIDLPPLTFNVKVLK